MHLYLRQARREREVGIWTVPLDDLWGGASAVHGP
jgi:hypothetical protein